MSDWLRPLLLMFHAPARAMAEVRDRAPLGTSLLFAFVAQFLFQLYVMWPHLWGAARPAQAWPGVFTLVAFKAAAALLFNLIVFVPVFIFVGNVMERRGNFGLTLRQEYAPAASTVLWARVAAIAPALLLSVLLRVSGSEAEIFGQSMKIAEEWQRSLPPDAPAVTALQLSESYAFTLMISFFAAWLVLAAREVFRFSWPRAAVCVVASGAITFPLMMFLWPFFEAVSMSGAPLVLRVLASPFLLLLLFLLMRGYIGELVRGRRASASFRQNLEASTLNPADASAHYNLGLLHLQRRELTEARARFERAIEIDPEEADAHYQLGRIARAERRWADAIAHYGEVVRRNEAHSQHEVWREAGATYVSAGQFEDARDALERFLEQRQSDPEGLYLMGRAQFGLGRPREAKEWMQSCIEAVRTAPAYKYRSEKRWAAEAQQFLRSLAA